MVMLGLFPGNIVLLRCISAPIDFDDLCSLFVFACVAPFSRNQAVDSYEKKKCEMHLWKVTFYVTMQVTDCIVT